MELIYVLDRRRLQRELRRRELELRRREAELQETTEAPPATEPESLVVRREAAEVLPDSEPKPESLVAQHAISRGWWECDFCGRGFHGYGRFVNHKCHDKD